MAELTQEQRRAKYALDQISQLKGKDCGNYASLVDGFPATVLMDGLGQALATLLAKSRKDKGPGALHEHIENWLCRNDRLSPYFGKPKLMEAVVSGTQEDYVLAQAETLALLVWLKKFSQAYLNSSKEKSRG